MKFIVNIFPRITNVLATINNDVPMGNCVEKGINFQRENIGGAKLSNADAAVIPRDPT